MSSETFSLLLWCWRDQQTNATQIRVLRVDTGEEVQFKDSSYLLRISTDAGESRCLIRHLTSGREAYIQSGAGIRAFIESSLLNNENTDEPPENTGAE